MHMLHPHVDLLAHTLVLKRTCTHVSAYGRCHIHFYARVPMCALKFTTFVLAARLLTSLAL